MSDSTSTGIATTKITASGADAVTIKYPPVTNMTTTEVICTSANESHRRIVLKSLMERVSSCPEDHRSRTLSGARKIRSKKFMRMRISSVDVGSTISHRRQYANDAFPTPIKSTSPPPIQTPASVVFCTSSSTMNRSICGIEISRIAAPIATNMPIVQRHRIGAIYGRNLRGARSPAS